MPRIILDQEHLATIQRELKSHRGVDFNTSNEEAVLSMLKYWCRESAKGDADVESVLRRDERYMIVGNREFFGALQKIL